MAMSGITLADGVMAAMSDLRMKKCRYVILNIGNENKNIVVTEIGDRSITYEDFIAKISTSDPCYAGFDFQYTDDDVMRDKLVLIQYIPDTAKPRQKMMYSSSREALSSVAEGFLPYQANDTAELDREELLRKVKMSRFA